MLEENGEQNIVHFQLVPEHSARTQYTFMCAIFKDKAEIITESNKKPSNNHWKITEKKIIKDRGIPVWSE